MDSLILGFKLDYSFKINIAYGNLRPKQNFTAVTVYL
jgi:hypothetical protein